MSGKWTSIGRPRCGGAFAVSVASWAMAMAMAMAFATEWLVNDADHGLSGLADKSSGPADPAPRPDEDLHVGGEAQVP